jgi:hypothetical protein
LREARSASTPIGKKIHSTVLATTYELTMKGDMKVIQLLNKQLINELTVINQYFLYAASTGTGG